VQDTTVVKLDGKDMLIVGLEDGTVGVMDLSASDGKSYKRPIFKMKDDGGDSKAENPHSQFTELATEHEDSVVSVEANMATADKKQTPLILSASKDGILYVWKLQQNTEENLKYVFDLDMQEGITKAKWLSETEIIIATTEGKVYKTTLKVDD